MKVSYSCNLTFFKVKKKNFKLLSKDKLNTQHRKHFILRTHFNASILLQPFVYGRMTSLKNWVGWTSSLKCHDLHWVMKYFVWHQKWWHFGSGHCRLTNFCFKMSLGKKIQRAKCLSTSKKKKKTKSTHCLNTIDF